MNVWFELWNSVLPSLCIFCNNYILLQDHIIKLDLLIIYVWIISATYYALIHNASSLKFVTKYVWQVPLWSRIWFFIHLGFLCYDFNLMWTIIYNCFESIFSQKYKIELHKYLCRNKYCVILYMVDLINLIESSYILRRPQKFDEISKLTY